nr:hypothetical protein HmN_000656400 [Hymenolepis microstoma]
MPTHKKRCAIIGDNDRSEQKLSSRLRDDIRRRSRMEKFARNRQMKRVKMCTIDEPNKTPSQNSSGDFRGRLRHQSSSSSSKTHDKKSSASSSANNPNLKRILNRCLNTQLSNLPFRQVSNERTKALESTVPHVSFGSASANIFTPGNQLATADIKTKLTNYIPQPTDFNMSCAGATVAVVLVLTTYL